MPVPVPCSTVPLLTRFPPILNTPSANDEGLQPLKVPPFWVVTFPAIFQVAVPAAVAFVPTKIVVVPSTTTLPLTVCVRVGVTLPVDPRRLLAVIIRFPLMLKFPPGVALPALQVRFPNVKKPVIEVEVP